MLAPSVRVSVTAKTPPASVPPAAKSSNPSGAASLREPVEKLCRDVLAPLVHADGGQLFLVKVTAEDVHIHLGGACAGCPGAAVTRERMLEPALKSVLPKARLQVTTGFRVPEGAEKIDGGSHSGSHS